MAELANEGATAFRACPRTRWWSGCKTDFHKMQEILEPLGPEDWTGIHGDPRLHGPGPGLLLRGRPADGLRRPLLGHPRRAAARRTASHGDTADLLVPFMFAIWQGTMRTDAVSEPFTIGIRVGGRNGGDYRVSVSSEGLTYEQGEIESLPALHRVRRRQLGAHRVRPGQLRHRPRRHGPGRALPEPVLPDLASTTRSLRVSRAGRTSIARSTSSYIAMPDRAAHLLGQVPDESGRPGQQREAAQDLDGEAEVAQDGAAGAGAVEGKRPAEQLRVDPPDRLEQRQVRSEQPFLVRDPQQHRRAWIPVLVHVVSQPGDVEPGRPLRRDRLAGQLVPAVV